ncbi:hypothetical protein D3C86_1724900 [compost metagenome]
MNTIQQYNQLGRTREETKYRNKDRVGDPCAYGSFIVLLVRLVKSLSEIITTVKSNDYFKIIQAFLYPRT